MNDLTASDVFASGFLKVLPEHLRERARLVHRSSSDPSTKPLVLYWMQTAVRTDENPALDVAHCLARHWKKPLLVYHALSERYAFSSDRHHTFILEGARDVQQQFMRLGIDYLFHLERPGHRRPILRELANQAAAVIVEDMPTFPPQNFLKAFRRAVDVSILAVDAACVLPMRLVGRAYDRAFAFREATQQEYPKRVSTPWPAIEPSPRRLLAGSHAFEGIDLSSQSIAELVAECEIDHLVGPVVDTQGGSQAGYARWNEFLGSKLKKYAAKRNDPLVDGTSRMSAYLHYGMVSPFRLAREAAAAHGEGGEKYLDELLIWREMAYGFCHFRKDYHLPRALPNWARDTLKKHAEDQRPKHYSWEHLARGITDDRLWNAAQRSLLIHGEIHNNVRMTWGKAFLNWTRNPKEALKMMIDLNHRYGLDGRDPASYGGILWCLGLFDRPFTPEVSITGVVRSRTTEEHATRLNIDKFSQRVSQLRVRTPPSIAVIGAGLSGAIAARTLSDHGLSVTVYEKSRGDGGRMATRRVDEGSFDHGAQYLTARDPRFARYVKSWLEQGVVAPWTGAIAVYDRFGQSTWAPPMDRYVGMPGMNAVAKHLLREAEVRYGIQVGKVRKRHERWELLAITGEGIDAFDRVIVTAPAPQSAEIVAEISELASSFREITMAPCWCVMIKLEKSLAVNWSGAFVNVGPIRWIGRNSTKPGREPVEWIVIHASPEWSLANLDQEPGVVSEMLFAELEKLLGLSVPAPLFIDSHRWRYSIPIQLHPNRCLTNADRSVIACGDWAGGPKVEGAFLSGSAAAGRVLSSLEYASPVARQLRLFDTS